jgi:signal transduction histidine kinase
VQDPTDYQPPLDRLGIAARYLCAAAPLLLYGFLLILAVELSPSSGSIIMWVLIDMGLGVLGVALIWWRRRWPWPIALATILLTVVSTTAFGAASVAYVSLCTHRRWRRLIPVGIVYWLCMMTNLILWQHGDVILFGVVSIVAVGALTVSGLYVRGRRDLAASEHQAALAAQGQRIEQAKLAERIKIAHEMHDVLAHRISLLSMLAGGLAYRTDLGTEETRETALAIQENAHQSLNELRAVLGTLRRDDAPAGPQPNLRHLADLFDEVRAAGQQVEVADTIDDRELLPTQTGRHAYRIVQEALTNARKHAPGTRVTAEIGGRPGEGLRIRVSNPAAYGTPGGPGGRLGLVGLAERTRMAGGTISHAVQDGWFVLDARLPWEA